MNLTNLLVEAAVTGIVNLLVIVFAYYAFQRREQLRDDSIADLNDTIKSLTQRVEFLQDRDVKELKQKTEDNAKEHGRMWKHMDDDLMSQKGCHRVHEATDEKIAVVAKDQARADATVKEMLNDIGEVKTLARLIATHLRIDWKGASNGL